MPHSKNPFTEHILDLLSHFESIEARRMFGGEGIFQNGIMFAIVDEGKLYLKTDDTNRARFEAENLPPLTFSKRDGRTVTLSYHQCPDEALQRADTIAPWAELGIDASLRQKK